MEKQAKVIDASVVIKWFLDEVDSDKAIFIRKCNSSDEMSLIVPDLIFSEILNGMKYKKFDKEELDEINFTLWNIGFIIKRIDKEILNKSIEIALRYNFTIYDSIYIALAQIHNTELITADEELAKCPNVKLLNKI
ncbi:type II toxin-antitoxin system VapC family toxin [Candidatus Pacearchaeota archaeon]|nr:type II toxin-antitoxin system VapC family toxin [Candidatus Pacearchaeota archaeon]